MVGGGSVASFFGTDYLFQHEFCQNIYLHEYQNQNIYYQARSKVLNAKKKKKSKKKKKKKKNQKWGGGRLQNRGWEEGKAALIKVGKHEDMKTNFNI